MRHDPNGPAAPHEMRDHFVEVNQLRLHWVEWGHADRAALLLLHGGSAHALWWRPVAERLAETCRVLALDLRGHGDSEWAHPPDYDLDAHAADVATFVQKVGLAGFTLAGHSYGGLVAMRAARALRSQMSRLAVLDIAPELTERGARYIRAMRTLARPVYESLEEAVARFQLLPRAHDARPEILRDVARTAFRRLDDGTWTAKFDRLAMGETRARDLLPEIRDLEVPLLFVRGEHSDSLTARDCRKIRDAIPRVAIEMVPNAHHHVMLDAPATVSRILGDFATNGDGELRPPEIASMREGV